MSLAALVCAAYARGPLYGDQHSYPPSFVQRRCSYPFGACRAISRILAPKRTHSSPWQADCHRALSRCSGLPQSIGRGPYGTRLARASCACASGQGYERSPGKRRRDRSSVVEQKMEDKNVGRRTEGREHKLHIPVLPETYCQQYADDWQRERNTSMRVKHERAHAPAIRGRNALAAPDSGTLSQQLFARLIEPA